MSTFKGLRPQITPSQCRAARALLDWTQGGLAERALLSRKTIADFEQATRTIHARTMLAMRETMERAGIEFIPDGVRLSLEGKFNKTAEKMI